MLTHLGVSERGASRAHCQRDFELTLFNKTNCRCFVYAAVIAGLLGTVTQPTPPSGPAGETNEMPTETRGDQWGCGRGEDAALQAWWRSSGEARSVQSHLSLGNPRSERRIAQLRKDNEVTSAGVSASGQIAVLHLLHAHKDADSFLCRLNSLIIIIVIKYNEVAGFQINCGNLSTLYENTTSLKFAQSVLGFCPQNRVNNNR